MTDSITDSEDSNDELLSDICLYCNVNQPIYTCPRCYARSCSVDCCKRHKVFRQCSGIRDPTAYVKRSRLMTTMGINRDYNFLTSIEREAFRPDATKEAGDAEKGVNKKALEAAVARRGINMKWAPWRGFERAKLNQTKLQNKGAKIAWTVQWILAAENNRRVLEHNVTENGQLQSVFQSASCTDRTRYGKAQFYLSVESPANTRRCVQLDANGTLRENLRERTVLEFPDIVVMLKGEQPIGWEVLPDQRKVIELKDLPKTGDHKSRKRKGGERQTANRSSAIITSTNTAKRKETDNFGNSVSSQQESKKLRIF